MIELSLHDALALSLLPVETRRHLAAMLHDAYREGFADAAELKDADVLVWTQAAEDVYAEQWYAANVQAVFKVDIREVAA